MLPYDNHGTQAKLLLKKITEKSLGSTQVIFIPYGSAPATDLKILTAPALPQSSSKWF